MSASAVNTLVEAAQTAIADGDYTTARTKLEGAAALLAGIADGGRGDKSLRFDREHVLNLLAYVNKRITSSQGLTRTPVTYTRTTA